MTPNFQRQHYLYWCNVYNLSQRNHAVFPNTTIRVLLQRYEKIANILPYAEIFIAR